MQVVLSKILPGGAEAGHQDRHAGGTDVNIYTCVDHEGHWVGVASVIVADNEESARQLLLVELETHGLYQGEKPFTLRQINITKPRAFVLQNGDY